MAHLLKWLKEGSLRVLDPDRNARIARCAARVEQEIAAKRSEFRLSSALQDLDTFREDLPLIVKEVYRSLLRRAWRDGQLSEGERKTLFWASRALELDAQTCRELNREVGLAAFEEILARSIDDGVLSEDEIRLLDRAATDLGWPLGQLVQTYFATESAGLLRGMFITAANDNHTATDEWSRLTATAERLGMSRSELLAAIQQPAERFVEQVMAEAKADGLISPAEDTLLNWLISNVISREPFKQYVVAELAFLKRMQEIRQGCLPSIRSRLLGLRAGEIVHAEIPARFLRTRQLKSGPRTDVFSGMLTLTDDRLFFHAGDFGSEVSHRRVVNIRGYRNGFELTVSGRGSGTYEIADDRGVFSRMYQVAVQKVNQTIVAPREVQSTRHIPRDVRQRVWQRCSGRCIECGATDYLEFDHIIPVAKGGGNTEANVQLLVSAM